MPEHASITRWLLTTLRRAIGTQAILDRLPKGPPQGVARPPSALAAAVTAKMQGLYERLAHPAAADEWLGFPSGQMPVLVDLNGDLIWVPAHVLRFLWHTRIDGEPGFIPHFHAERPHYLWIRDRLRPGDTAIDCGANLGLFTTMMAQRVGPAGSVHAFEPSPGAAADLGRVLRLNRLDCVVVNPWAVADRCGEAAFCEITEPDARREASHLELTGRGDFAAGWSHREVRVPVTTLDKYVADRKLLPRLVKIDVEGAEFHVLEGARQCVRDASPLLVIEIHVDERDQFDHERLQCYLEQYDYRVDWQDKICCCQPCGSA